jgi:transcriptional regulator with XRE-family HTH domain
VPDETPRAVPDRILEAREHTGLTLEAAAAALRWSPGILVGMELGNVRPSASELEKLSRLYRRPVAWLCGQGAQP